MIPFIHSRHLFVWTGWSRQVGYDHVPTKRSEYLDAMNKIMEAGLCEHPGGGCNADWCWI